MHTGGRSEAGNDKERNGGGNMERYKKPFYAVMRGMRGDALSLDEWGQYNYFGILETLEQVGNMERGDERYYSVGDIVGLVSHSTAKDARDWAHDTHESQHTDAFTVTRTARGWNVESIY